MLSRRNLISASVAAGAIAAGGPKAALAVQPGPAVDPAADVELQAALANFHHLHDIAEALPDQFDSTPYDQARRKVDAALGLALALPAVTLGGLLAKIRAIERNAYAGEEYELELTSRDWHSVRADIERLAQEAARVA